MLAFRGQWRGKTTTIRILTGLARPTSGVVKVAGMDVTKDMDQISHVIGYCPQHPAFYQDMTGQEWMHWVGRLFHLEKNHSLQNRGAVEALPGV